MNRMKKLKPFKAKTGLVTRVERSVFHDKIPHGPCTMIVKIGPRTDLYISAECSPLLLEKSLGLHGVSNHLIKDMNCRVEVKPTNKDFEHIFYGAYHIRLYDCHLKIICHSRMNFIGAEV